MLCGQSRGVRLLHNWSFFHPMIVEKSLPLNKFMEHHVAYSLHNFPRSASEWSWIFIKISHITMDFVMSQSSDTITLDLDPRLCIIWIWMRPKGVWMVSVDQDHAFPGRHLLQLGTRIGYSTTVVSRVPCARFLSCAIRLKGVKLLHNWSFFDQR